jgi:hypothetical protein
MITPKSPNQAPLSTLIPIPTLQTFLAAGLCQAPDHTNLLHSTVRFTGAFSSRWMPVRERFQLAHEFEGEGNPCPTASRIVNGFLDGDQTSVLNSAKWDNKDHRGNSFRIWWMGCKFVDFQGRDF